MIRKNHKSFFGKSDLLFICMLQPRTFDIEKQDLEIEAAQVLFDCNNTSKTVLLGIP